MLKITKAQERHIPDICNLWVEFMEFTLDVDPIYTLREYDVPWFEKTQLRPAMQNNNSLILVAVHEDKVVGYSYALIIEPAEAETRGRYGNIHDLFVTKDWRRKGLGEKLYHEMLGWFRERGVERVELHIISMNKLASSFWRKQGFTDFEQKMYRQI
jgi:GNAT superfamily N-acetyltransferase